MNPLILPLAAGGVDGVALAVLILLFAVVTVLGFMASRFRRGDSLASLDEWGLGGRGFGTFVTWFLLGGDLYTAYTFIAVPAAMFATGAVTGFFAVAYTILIYPIVFIFMPRMWSVSHSKGYVTAADFVRGRFDSRILALAVAVTGIVATMPYIALQLVGIQAVIDTIGIGGRGNAFVRDLPLLIAFAVLAAYTYSSGLRAPAIIAFVKDSLIYLVIAVATVYVGVHIGFHHLFQAAETKMTTKTKTGAPTGVFIPASNNYWAYSTLALGSALALFIYPHSMTAVLSGKSRNVIRRNTAILPAYSLLLAMLALLGYAAIASKTSVIGSDGKPNPQLAVPHFFRDEFPSWFAGVAYSAIAIGALVPAAIMSIAAANLFTRNIYKEYLRPQASTREEAQVSKIASLFVKVGALAAILGLDVQYALDLQLIGGVLILQVLPAVVFLLYGRWFHRWALLAGWAVGMASGAWMLYVTPNASTGKKHFGATQWAFSHLGFDTKTTIYPGVVALVLNVAVAVALTLLFRAMSLPTGVDSTKETDYHLEAGDPGVTADLEPVSAGSG